MIQFGLNFQEGLKPPPQHTFTCSVETFFLLLFPFNFKFFFAIGIRNLEVFKKKVVYIFPLDPSK